MTSPTTPRPSASLPDHCAGLFAFGLQLKQVKDPGSADQLRRLIREHFDAVGSAAAASGVDAADMDTARYALAAFFDEIVLGSHWSAREEWINRPLQMEMFGSFNAGEEFYEKLKVLRGRSDQRSLDLMEVYASCLGLGFKGKLADLHSQASLKALLQDLSREISAARRLSATELSPHWQAQVKLPDQVRRIPAWIVVAACAGFVLLIYVLLNYLLNRQVDTYLQSAGRTGGG